MRDNLDKFNLYAYSLLLILVFSIPTIIQSSLLFHNHSHKICDVSDTHLHEKINVCNLCDFTFSKKNYILNKNITIKIITNYKIYYLNFKTLLSTLIIFFDSRGPPLV